MPRRSGGPGSYEPYSSMAFMVGIPVEIITDRDEVVG
jgi:hypothetical protein